MTNIIQKCWHVSKDIQGLIKQINDKADETVLNIKANGVALEALKELPKDTSQH
jgi:hypothetical protein